MVEEVAQNLEFRNVDVLFESRQYERDRSSSRDSPARAMSALSKAKRNHVFWDSNSRPLCNF